MQRLLRRLVASERDRLRAVDFSDRGAVADVKLHGALEHKIALHHGMRADDDAWVAADAEVEPAVVLIDENSAVEA